MSVLGELTPEEKIEKAIYRLRQEHSFFGSLVYHLSYEAKTGEELRHGTAAIDKHGNMYFNPDYIEDLSRDEVKGVVMHEVMHPAFRHWERQNGRDQDLWNMATDLVINNTVQQEGYPLPEGALIPENDAYTLQTGYTIRNISDKTVEEIYSILEDELDPQDQQRQGQGQGNGQDDDDDSKGQGGPSSQQQEQQHVEKGFDEHLDADKDDEEEFGGENEMDEDDWENAVRRATIEDEIDDRGKVPAGLEAELDRLKEPVMNWRQVLSKYITDLIQVDYDWTAPNKKYQAIGHYMPSTKQEMLDVVVGLDTSGSVSEDQLEYYLGEVRSIVNGFQHVRLHIIQHDATVQSTMTVKRQDEVVDIDIKGRGGTDHRPVFDHIKEEHRNARLFIGFTDGMTKLPDEDDVPFNLDIIWVLDNHRVDMDYGRVVRVPESVQEAF